MKNKPLIQLDRLLAREDVSMRELSKTPTVKMVQDIRDELLVHIRGIAKSGDLPLMLATERVIVEGDLERHANSPPMVSSLKTAMREIAAIERHIQIVDDPAKYKAVDQAHSLPRNRKGSLPFDEARQALASHYTRLNNLDKSRLGDDEKRIIDARKSLMFAAGNLYKDRQAKSLGIDISQGKKQGRSL